MAFEPHHPDGSPLSREEIDAIPADEIYHCETCSETWDGRFCPTCHAGTCGICGEIVPKKGAHADPEFPDDPFCRRCWWFCEGQEALTMSPDLGPAVLVFDRHPLRWVGIIAAGAGVGWGVGRLAAYVLGGP